MSKPETTKPDAGELIRKLHERPQMPLAEWLQAPAHVHYKAFRMTDPRCSGRRVVTSFCLS